MNDPLRKLYAHLAWADERTANAVRTAAPPVPRALELFAHVVGAEHVWLARLAGRPASVAVWPALSADECARLARENIAAFTRLLDELTPADLATEIEYRNSAGAVHRSTREDILLHVALHGTYHRGQVAHVLRLAGAVPTPTDYIELSRGAPAATRVTPRVEPSIG